MHQPTNPHLDDFTLLRYVADDLDPADQEKATAHTEICSPCRASLEEIQTLAKELDSLTGKTADH